MKATDTIIRLTALGALLGALALTHEASAATSVTNVTLTKVGDFTEVTVPVPSRLLCEHFTEPAKADRPFRIVMNLCNAEHALAQQNFTNLPACMVKRIRTSQFASSPEPVVRVVLDLNASATYSVRTEADRLVIAIADPKAAPFALWQATPNPVMAKSAPVTNTAEPVIAMNKPVIEKPQITPPTPAPSEPPVLTASKSTATEPLNTAKPDVSETPVAHVDPPSVVEPAVDFVPPPQPLVIAPEILDAAPAAMSQTLTPPSTTTPTTTAPAVNAQEEQIWAAATNPVGVTPQPTVTPADTATTQEALIDRLKTKFFGNARAPRPFMTEEGLIAEQLKALDSNAFGPPSPGSDMNREALLERIRQAALENNSRIPANVLPSVPGGPIRMEVFYDDQGRRDPFEPLLKGMRSGFVADELPNVEALRMVGVLRDEDRALALLEDTDGHSYIMKPGDPVANGRVLSVGEMRTIVQVDEYGWTRTVVLQLSPRGADPSKAMGANALTPDPEPEPEPQQQTEE